MNKKIIKRIMMLVLALALLIPLTIPQQASAWSYVDYAYSDINTLREKANLKPWKLNLELISLMTGDIQKIEGRYEKPAQPIPPNTYQNRAG